MLYDTHAHLDDPAFRTDFAALLDRARAAGVTRLVTIGTDEASSRMAVELARRHAEIFAGVGWHPGQAGEAPADIRPLLRELAAQPKVVALGETGLDYHYLPRPEPGSPAPDHTALIARQRALFEQHMEVAAEVGLNVVVHQREAMDDTLAVMRPYAGRVRGVFHCFVGGLAHLRAVLDLGSLVSFTGILTFKNATEVRAALAAVPADSFMLETDCPYLAPVPYRGKRCEPAHLAETAAAVCAIRQTDMAELSRVTCRTAEGFFRGLTPA